LGKEKQTRKQISEQINKSRKKRETTNEKIGINRQNNDPL
jgi:hypothetical protein